MRILHRVVQRRLNLDSRDGYRGQNQCFRSLLVRAGRN